MEHTGVPSTSPICTRIPDRPGAGSMNEESLFAAALKSRARPSGRRSWRSVCRRRRPSRASGAIARRRRATRGILECSPGRYADSGQAEPPWRPIASLPAASSSARSWVKAAWARSGSPTRLQPVRRRVALKIVRTGADSARMLARFDQERQALALMDHPNIAKVFDAGIDSWGEDQRSGSHGPGTVRSDPDC